MFEDQVFCAKVCLQKPVFVSSHCWYWYRQHPDSCCATDRRGKPTAQYRAAWLVLLKWLEEYLSKQGIKDSETWAALHKELRPYRHPILSRLSKRMQLLATQTKGLLKRIARRTLPAPVHRWLWAHWHGCEYCPPVGWVRLGHLQRIMPISRRWGSDRGLPIDRYYIEQFLSTHALDIRGYVLEILDDTYTCKFDGERVTRSDVLHVVEGNPRATIVADLTCADHIPSDTFDGVILTQTLQFIYDVRAALKTLYRTLKPGGVLLATFPGISQISRGDMDRWGDYWRFMTLSSPRLLEEIFPAGRVAVEAYGNVLAAIAFLHGLVSQELHQNDLGSLDPDYEVLITARAVKPEVAV
jgi:SAM-dependent methyltransferase